MIKWRWPAARWLRLSLIGLALVMVGLSVWFWRQRQAAQVPELLTLQPESLVETLSITGVAQSERSVVLKAGVSARVLGRRVAENTPVAAGTVLLDLDTSQLASQLQQTRVNSNSNLQQAETELQTAQTQFKELEIRRSGQLLGLQNQLQQAEENVFFLERETARQQRLRAEGVGTAQGLAQQQQQLEQARLQLQNSRLALSNAQNSDPELRSARSRIEQARTALASARRQAGANVRLAEDNLRAAVLAAPFNGSVTRWQVERGDYVTPGSVLGQFQDLKDLRLYLAANELDFPKIQLGASVEIVFDAYPERTFKGAVTWRSAASISDNENLQVFPVKVWFADPEALIKPGMSGEALITVAARDNALAVPIAAIERKDGQLFVRRWREGEAEEVPVEIGVTTLDKVEVRKGLQAGDQIVLSAGAS
ncbi:MAG: efflux RND transporter periplasmic adaptor subunit [Candidatus Sericytochromatia bacterium]|nr:efflux RND transporter periplasmic adaptor subunit [Candidatus Sericytochromatia bacterium]